MLPSVAGTLGSSAEVVLINDFVINRGVAKPFEFDRPSEGLPDIAIALRQEAQVEFRQVETRVLLAPLADNAFRLLTGDSSGRPCESRPIR